MTKKISILFIVFIILSLAAEILLRLTQPQIKPIQIANSAVPKIDQHFNILFLGNAHTYGAGVSPDKAYPALLQNFFKKNAAPTNVQFNFYNAGMLGANTTEIYLKLDKFTQDAKPDLALIMAGEANFWNKNGFGDFLSEADPFSNSKLNNSFLISWIMTKYKQSQQIKKSTEQQNEITVYKEVTQVEDLYLKKIAHDPTSEATLQSLNQYIIQKQSGPPQGIWRAVLYLYSRYNFYLNDNLDLVFDAMEKSINFDPNTFDALTYLLIDELNNSKTLNAKQLERLESMSKKLTQHPEFINPKDIEQYLAYSLKSQHAYLNQSSDPQTFLEKCHKLFPSFAVPSSRLSQIYLNQNKPEKAYEVLLNTITANPFARRDNIIKQFMDLMTQNPNIGAEQKAKAQEFITKFGHQFPSEKFIFDNPTDEKIYEWISWDIRRIQQKLSDQNIPLIVQNYHWIRDPAKGHTLNQRIISMSEELKIPFIDINDIFQKTAEQSGQADNYFVRKYGANDSHPSELGHRLIAYAIYKKMVEQNLLPEQFRNFNPQELLNDSE